jgi:PHD/YefM family antitoxin component YafN of YafNO toxin-antitoxin module
MTALAQSMSVEEFRAKTTETLDRLNQTGEAEAITVDGDVRAVLVAPAVYKELWDEFQLARDVETFKQSMKEYDEGKFMEAGEFFRQLRAELEELEAQQSMDQAK